MSAKFVPKTVADLTNTPAGNIAATDGQTAINELDTEKAPALGADDNYVTDAEKIVLGNTSGTNTGDSATPAETATTIGALIGGAADATPNDTDFVATSLTAAGVLKKITWTNVKAFLKTYFDTLYNLYVHPNHSGDVTSVADGATTIVNKQTLSATAPITVSNTPTVVAAAAPVIAIPAATASVNGYATATQITKLDGIAAGAQPGTVTSVSGTAPIASSGGTTPAISLNDAGVTYAKIQNISATDKVLGRATAEAGVVEEIACTAFARSILDDANEATFKATVNLEANTDFYAPSGTDVPIADGGTGQSTAQLAINALTAVAAATNEHVLTKDTTTGNAIFKVGTGGGGGVLPYIYIRDEKTAGTGGGTFTSGAWRTRDLNTEVVDTDNLASVASNQITLAAGTYRFVARCPTSGVDAHRAILYNVTAAATIILGSGAFSSYTYRGTVDSSIRGRFTLSVSSVLELRHYCQTTSSGTLGFGEYQVNAGGGVEVYSEIEFWKEA